LDGALTARQYNLLSFYISLNLLYNKQMEKIIVFAPHPDDEALGMGGSIAKMSAMGHEITVVFVSAHMSPMYSEEVYQQVIAESKIAAKCLGVEKSIYLNHAATSLRDCSGSIINNELLEIIKNINPTQVYVPFFDRHSDHRAVFEAAMVATRPIGAGSNIKLVAAYETISSTHWNAPGIEPTFTPNLFIDITEYINNKVEAVSEYESQVCQYPHPRSLKALEALALFRGSQSGSGYAEAFQVIRMNR
jgi:LmbE family N-acetylglucosaminyl deacetylase